MKPRPLLALLALALSASALASPATTLFERAVSLVNRHYNGFSDARPADLAREGRAALRQACAGQESSCQVSNGQAALTRYLNAFHDGHLYYLSPDRYAATKARYTVQVPAEPTYGLVLGTRGRGGTLVVDVASGSPAEGAGLLPGDRIVSVDGGAVPSAGDLDTRPEVRLNVARGPVEGAEQRAIGLTRASLSALLLPELYAPADAPPGVLVLRVPNFQYAQQVGPRVHQLVHEAQARGATGLILDLRGGRGGSNYECEMAAGAFVGPFAYQVRTRLGTFQAGWNGTRSLDDADRAYQGVAAPWTEESLAYDVQNPARWTGQTAVLVDEGTASCHEYAAYFLQQFGHVPVLGVPTRGLLNTGDLVLDLPDGGALFLPAFRSLGTDGTTYPERVTPDISVPPDPQGFADTGRDPMLEAAYRALTSTARR